jgi:beta-glucanase (GH16 family)
MRILLYIIVMFCILACIKPPIPFNESKWDLVWREEFNYEGLPDGDKWGYEIGYIRNGETQYYTEARTENCFVSNGILKITALNDTFQGYPVTSASIETLNKFHYKYGRMEVRAKMPHAGEGSWPAIWSMGVNRSEVGWPKCGEIDIMEWVGRYPLIVLGSLFSQAENSSVKVERHWAHLVSNPDILTKNFNIYAVEWEENRIKFFFNDINYITYTRQDLGAGAWEPFRKDHYLKLNLAMGGNIDEIGGGGPIDYTKFPFTFEVDYVRYYIRKN